MKIERKLNQPESWKREARLEKILALLKKAVKKKIDPDTWVNFHGELGVEESCCKELFSLTDAEVERCASASCLVDLWAFRALGSRICIPVPKLDWYWYNN